MLVQVGKRYVSEQREIDPLFAKAMQELLSRSKVFQDTHEEFIRDLIVSCNRREYPVNRYLMEEGMQGDSMYVLFKGVVEVTSGGRYVCKLKDGSIIGETALLNVDNRRTASVRSLARCDVAIISRFSFHSILEKYPWEKRKFQREMKHKLMELGKLIDVKDDINLEQQATQCDALKQLPFFSDSSESMHEFVAELAMNTSTYWYKPGKVLIQEGDGNCDEMFILLRGACEVSSCGQFLGRIENDIIGEIGILDLLERRTATVKTASACQCMKLSRQVMVPILAKYPDARLRLLELARTRLTAISEAMNGPQGGPENGTVAVQDICGRLPGCAIGFGPHVQQVDASLLAMSPIFQDAPIPLVYALSQRMVDKKFEDGEVILKDGEGFQPGRDYVYFIVKGEVEIWKDGNFVVLLKDGEAFGDLAALRKLAARQATAKAKGQVSCRAVLARSLLEVLEQHPNDLVMEIWEEIMTFREAQMKQKLDLQNHLTHKTVDIDFMFFKLPAMQKDPLS
ncbi:HCN4 [Symbiodinium natans]|uniref:HCN4 protein n=1 Tax=Symbiodinium natans TaxID=878477 RepID=A0A812S5H4_9DINO|nr:HCN4 [Symbiodinium natans]